MTQKDLEKILKSKKMTIDDYFKNLSCGYDITQNLTKPIYIYFSLLLRI